MRGLNREGGLIKFLPLKRVGLLEGGGLFETGRGGAYGGFTVSLLRGNFLDALPIRHFRNEKGTGARICLAIDLFTDTAAILN